MLSTPKPNFDERQVRLFPLDGVVLLPHGLLPLHIFEPRYRQMSADALDSDREVTMILPAASESLLGLSEPVPLDTVACIGAIHQEQQLPDGRYLYWLCGKWRVRLVEEVAVDSLYRQARVVPILDYWSPQLQTRRELQRAEITSLLRRLLPEESEAVDKFFLLIDEPSDAGTFADLVGYAAPVSLEIKRRLLESGDVDERLEILAASLREILQTQGKCEDLPFFPQFSPN